MDGGRSRSRMISILNDDDNPSFAVPPRQTASPPITSPGAVPRQERPTLHRHHYYSRGDSPALSPRTPPLLRLDSTSSTSTMDSPSPATPIYSYEPLPESQLVTPYETLLRADSTSFPMSSGLTPDESLQNRQPFGNKIHSNGGLPMLDTAKPSMSYPVIPSESEPTSPQTSAPPASSSSKPYKKNKYPCPYASSHACTATFTTSGHAARHGKKHTGEKGVHCPVCNKAFTRKDNMKQHERTHKMSVDDSNSKAKDELRRKKTKPEQLHSRNESWNEAPSPVLEDDVLSSNMDTSMDDASMYESADFASGAGMEFYPAMNNESVNGRPVTPRTFSELDRMSGGLDTLAMAASNVSYGPYGS